MKKRQKGETAGLVLVRDFKYRVTGNGASDKYPTLCLPAEAGLVAGDRVHVLRASGPGTVRLRRGDVVLRAVKEEGGG